LIVATLRRVALAQTLPRGERGPRLATDLQPRPVPQSYPAGSGIGSGGVRVFQNKILGSASELVLGVKTRRCHGAFFAPGLSLWIFQRDTLFCLYTEVSYPGYAPWPLHGRAAMCEKHSGEYRENKAGKYREPLQHATRPLPFSLLPRRERRTVFLPLPVKEPQQPKPEPGKPPTIWGRLQ